MSNQTMKITADFSVKSYESMERIANNLSITKAEAIGTSLDLIEFILMHKNFGWKLILEKDNMRMDITNILKEK